ncbi:MAG: YkgJ family cysteine cluster protein [Phycisphaerae bacterium]|nr:YkgJ family cysteine cluster protein [Phycisphaerae bacterium]
MNLPIIWPDIPKQHFECRGCTRCCRELVVHLTRDDRERIDAQKWGGRLPVAPYVQQGRSFVLNHAAEGGCVFLAEDGRCRIHAEFGAAQKPLACRLYPFTIEAGPQRLHVGLRYDCPTVAANSGLALAAHKSDVKLVAEALLNSRAITAPSGSDAVEVAHSVRVSARTADDFSSQIERWIQRASIPMGKRLFGLCRLAVTLGEARLGRLDEESLAELVVMLGGGIQELAADQWDEPPGEPSSRSMRLLRQTVFSHCEYITFRQMFSGFLPAMKLRWNQLGRAGIMTRGTGMTPALRGIDGVAAFSGVESMQSEQAAAATSQVVGMNESADLLTRYLVARLQARTVFGRGYYGWPIVDGLIALLLSVAAAGWLARCNAAASGRGLFGVADVQRAISIIDRSAGRLPELGSKAARLRVRYLADNGIDRLLAKFAT